MPLKTEPAGYVEIASQVIEECGASLNKINPENTSKLIDHLCSGKKVFLTGVGRVLIAEKYIAKRFAHLGIDVHIVGDIAEPRANAGDILIAASGSGESIIPVTIAKKAKNMGLTVIWIGSNTGSTLAKLCDIRVRIPVLTKLNLPGEMTSAQPMTTLFEQTLFLYGDILAMMVMDKKDIDRESLWNIHANLE
jgi:6-phospho-3-hexuloisomerase